MKLLTTLILIIFTIGPAYGQRDQSLEESAIRNVINSVEKAWVAGDGKAFADNFTDDVDYTVWNGLHFKGRTENIKNHQEIFDTFYKGTRVELKPKKIRFLADDIAVVHLSGRLFRGKTAVPTTPAVLPLMVLIKADGNWKITVFQNTPIIKRGELVVGRKPNP